MSSAEGQEPAGSTEASDPQTSPNRLKELFDESDYETQRLIAENPNCDQEMQMAFVNISHGGIRTAVAKNKGLAVSHLVTLASDGNEWVRAGVASNDLASPQLLTNLARDESAWVRQNVAQNPNTPVEMLRQLATEGDEDVQQGLAENPSLPEDLSHYLFGQKTAYSSKVHRSLAENPSTVTSLLEQLSKSEDRSVREGVAGQSHCALEVALALTQDTESSVRLKLAETTRHDEVLKALAIDSDEDVRGATYENPASPDAARASAALLGLPKKDDDDL